MATKVLGVGLAFGDGGTNISLASLISTYSRDLNYVSVQHEIGTSLINEFHLTPNFQVREHRKQVLYLNTLECLEQIVADWQNHEIDPRKNQIWVFCHSSHASGIRSMLKRLGVPVHRFVTTSVYDPKSSQWWTRGPLHVLVYKVFEGYRYWRRGEVTFSNLLTAFFNDVILRKN